jgi:hypothetical protein
LYVNIVCLFTALPISLKSIGLLAQQPHSGEQLAEMLGLSASTVSHHLSILAHVELVSATLEQCYNVYSFNIGALQSIAQRLLSRDDLPRLAEDVDRTAYDRKVLKTFVRADGTIRSIPAQEKKFQVLLHYVLEAFEPGKGYSEKQVNNVLSRYSDDDDALRRGLIEYQLMAREVTQGSSTYWRIDQ